MCLKEVNALLAERNGDLHPVFFQHELIWRREKVVNDL